jgi:hypothetical protein
MNARSVYAALASLSLLSLAGLAPTTAEPTTDTIIVSDGAVLSGTINEPTKDFLIPEGTTAYYEKPLCLKVKNLNLLGRLVPKPNLELLDVDAPSLSIVAALVAKVQGYITTPSGQGYGWQEALAGLPGSDGGSIFVSAPHISIGDSAQLVAGNGGTGQSITTGAMMPWQTARAGSGGQGGWIVLQGQLDYLPTTGSAAYLMPGIGGPGGAIISPADILPFQLQVGQSGASGGIVTTDGETAQTMRDTLTGLTMPSSTSPKNRCTDDGEPGSGGGGGGGGGVPPTDWLTACTGDAANCVIGVIAPTVLCNGFSGADADASGVSGAAGNPGAPGTPGAFQGGAGNSGTNGISGTNGGSAHGGDGTEGCMGFGCGGSGGNAMANGGSGGRGGDGGKGGDSNLGVGGDGGAGGSGGNGGNKGAATAGHAASSGPACTGTPGHDGIATATPGAGGAGGSGGAGGHGLIDNGSNGANGTPGSNGN